MQQVHPDVVLCVGLEPDRPVRETVGAEAVAGQAIMWTAGELARARSASHSFG